MVDCKPLSESVGLLHLLKAATCHSISGLLQLVTENAAFVQVEAATGGQDVVKFCGGLRPILAAANLPLGKALPALLQSGPTAAPLGQQQHSLADLPADAKSGRQVPATSHHDTLHEHQADRRKASDDIGGTRHAAPEHVHRHVQAPSKDQVSG